MATEPSILTTGLFTFVENLRRTLMRVVLVFGVTSGVAYPFAAHLLHVIKQPLDTALIMYSPLEGFLGYIKVSFATGFVLTSPLLLYEVKRFLQFVCRLPSRLALMGMVATAGLFCLGVSFSYVVILPVTLNFLLSYGGDNIAAGISVSKYLSLTLGLSAACGVIFELPLVTLILYQLGLISPAFLAQYRRYAIVLSALVTAILTPTPDAFTMSLVMVPLLGLYEVSILLLRIAERRQAP